MLTSVSASEPGGVGAVSGPNWNQCDKPNLFTANKETIMLKNIAKELFEVLLSPSLLELDIQHYQQITLIQTSQPNNR